MTVDEIRCCGTCRWWQSFYQWWEEGKQLDPEDSPATFEEFQGRHGKEDRGWCQAPEKYFPACVLDTCPTLRTNGQTCPAWEIKT